MQETDISAEALYSHIPKVRIDPEGTFKYIIINLEDKKTGQVIEFVRGEQALQYHKQIFNKFLREELVPSKFKVREQVLGSQVEASCPGGGRIVHTPAQKKLFVYGYSMSYGRGDHPKAIEFLKEAFSGYPKENFTWSNEGY